MNKIISQATNEIDEHDLGWRISVIKKFGANPDSTNSGRHHVINIFYLLTNATGGMGNGMDFRENGLPTQRIERWNPVYVKTCDYCSDCGGHKKPEILSRHYRTVKNIPKYNNYEFEGLLGEGIELMKKSIGKDVRYPKPAKFQAAASVMRFTKSGAAVNKKDMKKYYGDLCDMFDNESVSEMIERYNDYFEKAKILRTKYD